VGKEATSRRAARISASVRLASLGERMSSACMACIYASVPRTLSPALEHAKEASEAKQAQELDDAYHSEQRRELCEFGRVGILCA
jgi:hypothetical protein